MKLYHNKIEHNSSINIASLIDVVFLLIIFFMTVSHINATEALPLDLPIENNGTEEVSDLPAQMIINIKPSGQININGLDMNMEKFQSLLEAVAKNNRQNEIIIRADRNVRWSFVREALDVCSKCNLHELKVKVIENN